MEEAWSLSRGTEGADLRVKCCWPRNFAVNDLWAEALEETSR